MIDSNAFLHIIGKILKDLFHQIYNQYLVKTGKLIKKSSSMFKDVLKVSNALIVMAGKSSIIISKISRKISAKMRNVEERIYVVSDTLIMNLKYLKTRNFSFLRHGIRN